MAAFLRHQPALRSLVLALIAGIGFFVLGWTGILAWGGNAHSSTPIWLATAFGICLILRLSRSRAEDAVMVAAMLPAGLLANWLGGATLPLVIGFSLINIIDVAAALVAIRALKVKRITTVRTAVRFGLAAAISPALVGAVFSWLLVQSQGGDGAIAGLQWLLANFLGVCIVFPLGMTISLHQISKLRLKQRAPEAALMLAVVAGAAILTYHLSTLPTQFLVLTAAAMAGIRFRMIGTGVALLAIATTALTAPIPGGMPLLLHVEWMQFFLAVCSIVSMRAAMLMNQRDMLLAIIERRRRRAVRASRFKSQLLAHVSHEVRTPLSAVIGFSGMLETGALSAERAPEFASIIVHNGELLQRLHDDLLDLSRAEAGALSVTSQKVRLADTVYACVGGIRLDTALGGKQVVVDPIAEELTVTADPLRLAQIINNLIANAYKYGDNYSPIRVTANATDDGYGRIEVINAGPGIPENERDNIFRPFTRSAGVGRSVPGAGLGLSIAKLLVEMQGGRIDFHSTPGRQTRFWVDLPLAA
jgi:signal transduction histidine kinase